MLQLTSYPFDQVTLVAGSSIGPCENGVADDAVLHLPMNSRQLRIQQTVAAVVDGTRRLSSSPHGLNQEQIPELDRVWEQVR